MREFALEGLSPLEILRGFVDVREFAAGCKFRNCQHQQEPGCEVKSAAVDGRLHPLRLQAYNKIRSND